MKRIVRVVCFLLVSSSAFHSLPVTDGFFVRTSFAATEEKKSKKPSVTKTGTDQKKTRLPAVKTPSSAREKGPTASQGVVLSLADSVFLGMRNNRTIKSASIERVIQKFDLRVAEDAFTPQFSIDGDVSHQKVARSVSSIGTLSPKASLLVPTGATFDFAWINAVERMQQGNVMETAFEARVTQPLLRGGGGGVTTAPLKSARLGERINRLRLKQTVMEMIGQIIFAHRDLLRAQEQQKLAKASLERAEDLLDVNKALIQGGRMAEMEIVQTEADIENRRIAVLETNNALETTRLNLLSLLALELKTPIVAGEDMKPTRRPADPVKLLPVAFAQRPDYQIQTLVVEQQKLGVTTARNEQLWDVSVFTYGRSGNESYSGGLSGSNRKTDLGVGLSFRIPLDDLSREQPFVGATTSLRVSELHLETVREGVEAQIRSVSTQVEIRWRQLELAQRSQDLAARAVSIEKEKLKVGRSSNFQVRLLENDLRSAENQYLNAAIGYLDSLTLLDLQLGTALDTWRIALRD